MTRFFSQGIHFVGLRFPNGWISALVRFGAITSVIQNLVQLIKTVQVCYSLPPLGCLIRHFFGGGSQQFE